MEAYPEAKVLLANELTALHRRFQDWHRAADEIGASEAFARQNSRLKKKRV
jgi:hypothetical protein